MRHLLESLNNKYLKTIFYYFRASLIKEPPSTWQWSGRETETHPTNLFRPTNFRLGKNLWTDQISSRPWKSQISICFRNDGIASQGIAPIFLNQFSNSICSTFLSRACINHHNPIRLTVEDCLLFVLICVISSSII